MIGIVIQLIVSWVLLRFIAGENLSVLGLSIRKTRVKHFAVSFLLAATCCLVYQFMKVSFADNHWLLNRQFTVNNLFESTFLTFKSVVFEELTFRGALLFLVAKLLGERKGVIISAVCFGIYHWFSYGAFGNIFQMAIIFLTTGFLGWVLALAFVRTKSLFLPLGLHLGWNLLNVVVFSSGPLGDQLLVKSNGNQAEGVLSLFVYLFQVLLFPLLALWYVKKSTAKL